MAKKIETDYSMTCQQCGAKMAVYMVKDDRFMTHCFGCGQIMFGPVPLLERLKYSDSICPHNPAKTPCKGGWTSWCSLCRVRSFFYEQRTS